ncbi:hypothetical protein K491DRAFT_203758 [Lophiostoma macrostomum CBS 122681]|uniref:Mid2 domain-containing protein n=1 Tax=Lophiostoma macrostomum CBS 122681 TaxID=1314788 RepID=A0A6A6TJ48_9PLEO|nr:hypothetical protein K491DRAFT_203758 [Lophiostoma macrostomum CBS 122681]
MPCCPAMACRCLLFLFVRPVFHRNLSYPMYSLISLATVLFLSSTTLAQDCFFPNSDLSGSDTACDPSSLVSACCFDGQACLSNGLCVSDPLNATAARDHRGTCTDKDWKSGNCPRHCLDTSNNGANVYSCNVTGSDTYCCGDGCSCDGGYETFDTNAKPADVFTVTIIGNASFTQTHTSTSSSASTATSASTVQTTAASSSSPPASSGGGSSSGTAIGVGVGVGVGVAAILAGAAFWFWRRKRHNAQNGYAGQRAVEADNTEYYPPQKYAQYANLGSSKSAMSSSAQHEAYEMPTTNQAPVELPTSPGLRK